MKRGSTDNLRGAATLIAKCEVESPLTQSELDGMVRRLQELASDITAAAVRKVAGV